MLVSSFMAAFAALFAAFAAWFSYQTQNKILLNSIRPEPVLSGWSYSSDPSVANIGISSIQNVGVSSALHIWAELNVKGDTCSPSPGAFLMYERISLLTPGEKKDIEWEGRLFWKCSPVVALGMIDLDLKLAYVDINGNKRETIYELLAQTPGSLIGGTQALVPGLNLERRYSKLK